MASTLTGIRFVGAGTLLRATSMLTGETKTAEFADTKSAIGTSVTCSVVGSGGTFRVYKIMRGTENHVEISEDTVTAGLGNPFTASFDFVVGHGIASFEPTTFGDVTSIEIEFRSKGR